VIRRVLALAQGAAPAVGVADRLRGRHRVRRPHRHLLFQHLVSYNQLLFVYQSEGLTGGGFDQGTVPSRINVLNEVFVPSADDFGLFLLVVLPLVTMRVFAEERANGTDELLLTSGLRPWEVALAKHGVTYLFVLGLLAASAIYPPWSCRARGLGFEHLLALYVGQLCYGCAIASIGLACSSFTASQIVAAVLGYSIPFVLLDFAWLTNTVSKRWRQSEGDRCSRTTARFRAA
jgi:hypothetical protein